MNDVVRQVLPGRLRRLFLTVLLTALHFGLGYPKTALEDHLWQQLQAQEPTISLSSTSWQWFGNLTAALTTSVTIIGPGSIMLRTPGSVITGSGRQALLALRDVTLFYSSGVFSTATQANPRSSPFPAFDTSGLTLTLSNVTVIAPLGALADASSFWSADALQSALQPPGSLGSRPQRLVSYSSPDGAVSFSNVVLVPASDKTSCFTGGEPVGTSADLKAAMLRTNVTSVFVFQNITLNPYDFNYSRPVNLTGNRSVELYGCPGTEIDCNYNWTRFGIQTSYGGSVTLRGLTFTNTPLVNQLFWPRFLAPLLGLVYVGVGGGCTINNASIISPDDSDLKAYMATFADSAHLASAAKPIFTSTASNLALIASWNVAGTDVWGSLSPGVSADLAAASFWRLRGVQVETRPPGDCLSLQGVPGVSVDTGARFRELISDEKIPAIRITADIKVIPSEWPPEASGPEGGRIFVNSTKEVYACHPVMGQRYNIDWGNLGQVIFVFGTLRFRGDLLMTHPRPSPRRSWLYLLIGALSVETDGVIQFDGLEIRGNTSSPFTNAADPFWNYQSNCAPYCSGFIPATDSYLNVSYYDAFIFQYRFNKTQWVAVSQGRNITGAGFWGYTDVALTWRPDNITSAPSDNGGVPVAAIAVPAAVGGSLLVAGIVLCVLWRRRRAAAAAAAANAAKTASGGALLEISGVSYPGATRPPGNEGHGSGSHPATTKDTSTPQQDSSGNDNAPTKTVMNSTTFSQATSMLSGSAPTEARIEDMKRAITAQNVLLGSHRNEQITLTDLLGEGTFGKVYRGTWRGTTVAVKTMVLPTNMSGKEKREKMAVMETAISSSLSHPNIVQTYTYAILPVKGDGNQLDTKLTPGASVTVDSTSPLAALSTTDVQNVHSWEVRLVLEYCDRGSLRDVLNEAVAACLRARSTEVVGAAAAVAADGNLPAAPPPQRPPLQQAPEAAADTTQLPLPPAQGLSVTTAPPASQNPSVLSISRESCPLGYSEVLESCLDVARAMLHMHSENIVHGDLKARNILLKSGGVGDGRSYVAKVGDFGLSLRIDPHETHVSNVYQGTITHMAPEVLLHGKISKSSDVYAFAILMWETYTAGQAFKGTPRALLGHEVTKMNRRPQFPMDTPFEFQLLACRCWESDASIRPTFEQIVEELSRMKAKLSGEPGARATGLGPPLSGSLAMPTTAGGGGGGGADGSVTEPPAPDSIMTGSTAALQQQPVNRFVGMPYNASSGGGGGGGGFSGGGGGAIRMVPMAPMRPMAPTFDSETLSTSSTTLPAESTLAGMGLFLMGGVGGSTIASQSEDGLNVTPGALTIGTRPPFFGGGSGLGGAGVSGLGGISRPSPPMPPILEAPLIPDTQQDPEPK